MTDYSPWKRLLLELQHELEARQVCIAAHGRAVVPIDSEAQAVARGNDEVVAFTRSTHHH